MWIHGTAVRLETEAALSGVWRAGSFVELRGRAHAGTWVHYAIPTPVIVEGQRLTVAAVLVRYRSNSPGALLTNVHVFDGDARIKTYDGLTEAPQEWRLQRWAVDSPGGVRWGVGISMYVAFGAAASESVHLQIASVGCELVK